MFRISAAVAAVLDAREKLVDANIFAKGKTYCCADCFLQILILFLYSLVFVGNICEPKNKVQHVKL